MAPLRKAPTDRELLDYIEKGFSQAEIAREHERKTGIRVPRSTISSAVKRAGLTTRAAHRHDALIPWQLRPEHRYHRDARYLRLEARKRLGLPLNPEDQRRLTQWLRLLEDCDAVVHYEPRSLAGFWWLKRKPFDTDIIRDPEAVKWSNS